MKKALILLTAALLLLLSGCMDYSDITDQAANIAQMENQYVQGVKNGTNPNYPGITYSEAFDAFFSHPTWKYFEGVQEGEDTNGDGIIDTESKNVDVVEFTGYCLYQDVEVKALIQFILSEDGETFTAEYLSFNEVPQGQLILTALIEKVFESYGSDETEVTSEPETDNQEQATIPEDPTETETPTDSEDFENEVPQLVGILTLVSSYDHDEYYYLPSEPMPTIYLYSDYSFEFCCSINDHMITDEMYTGYWSVEEGYSLHEYHFAVTSEPATPNLDFYIYQSMSGCDAEFYSDYYMDDMFFGLPTVEEAIFHVDRYA